MKRTLISAFIVLILQGCASLGHREFYTQVAPTKYPATEKTMVFKYATVSIKEIYDLLFSDFLVIGRSSFNGPYEDPAQSVPYAQSIGADIFVSTAQFKETRTAFLDLSTPTSSTTLLSGTLAQRRILL
jgi:hypothetical protein